MDTTFSCSAVDMLVISTEICKNLKTHLPQLTPIIPDWADPYCADLQDKIDGALEKFVGFDRAKDMKKLTMELKALQAQAKKDISLFKTIIEVRFADAPEQREFILDTLGINKYYTPAISDQEDMIQLLYKFQQNMTTELQNQLLAKGITVTLINTILSHAQVIKELDADQEVAKGERKQLTQEAVTALNAIYTEIIGICKIARKIFSDNEAVRNKFSFKRLLRTMNNPHFQADENEEDTQP